MNIQTKTERTRQSRINTWKTPEEFYLVINEYHDGTPLIHELSGDSVREMLPTRQQVIESLYNGENEGGGRILLVSTTRPAEDVTAEIIEELEAYQDEHNEPLSSDTINTNAALNRGDRDYSLEREGVTA